MLINKSTYNALDDLPHVIYAVCCFWQKRRRMPQGLVQEMMLWDPLMMRQWVGAVLVNQKGWGDP